VPKAKNRAARKTGTPICVPLVSVVDHSRLTQRLLRDQLHNVLRVSRGRHARRYYPLVLDDKPQAAFSYFSSCCGLVLRRRRRCTKERPVGKRARECRRYGPEKLPKPIHL